MVDATGPSVRAVTRLPQENEPQETCLGAHGTRREAGWALPRGLESTLAAGKGWEAGALTLEGVAVAQLTASRPSTVPRSEPYLRNRRPPAFVARFPPMWQVPFAPKSRGMTKPRSSTCRLSSSRTHPAWQTRVPAKKPALPRRPWSGPTRPHCDPFYVPWKREEEGGQVHSHGGSRQERAAARQWSSAGGDSAPREHVTSLETLLVGEMLLTSSGWRPGMLSTPQSAQVSPPQRMVQPQTSCSRGKDRDAARS